MPRDIWPTVWDRVEELIKAGEAFIPRQVLLELERVDDDCAPWARGFAGFVVEANDDEVQIVTEISVQHGEWVSGQRNEADPWVVAHAVVRFREIVTEEVAAGAGVAERNLKIPNVAGERGINCLRFNDLARAEGWKF